MEIAAIVIQSLYAVFAANCLRAVFVRWYSHSRKKRWLLLFFLMVFLAVTPVAGCYMKEGRLRNFFQASGNLWLGYFMFYEVFRIILSIIPKVKEYCIPIALSLSLILNVYGLYTAQNLQVTSYTIGEGKNTYRIVLAADLHLSVNSNTKLIQKMVNEINESQPDAVLFAGDFFTSSYTGLNDPEAYIEILNTIDCENMYGVYGNHDTEEDLFGGFALTEKEKAYRSEEMTLFLKEAGITMLEDESIDLNEHITVYGRKDGQKTGDGVNVRLGAEEFIDDSTSYNIILEHEPYEYEELEEAGADLVLSGHTHDGQIFPGNFIVRLFNENGYGYKKIESMDTIVTSGVGYYGPPIRIGTKSEIVIIDIRY